MCFFLLLVIIRILFLSCTLPHQGYLSHGYFWPSHCIYLLKTTWTMPLSLIRWRVSFVVVFKRWCQSVLYLTTLPKWRWMNLVKKKMQFTYFKKVFERGLKAIPLSVDLWIHYLTHVKQSYTENEAYIRSQFERAVTACGLEFRSDKLWEAYIKWETENKRLNNVISVYDRLLTTPTQGYSSHFEKYV